MEPPKGVDVPFVADAPPFMPPKGLFVDDAGGKSKPPVGGWNALGAGKELLVNVLLEFDDCAGGKLLVALPPKALPPNIPPDAFEPLSPPMGAVAPKLKLGVCCPPPKFTLCERPCVVALAVRRCSVCLVRTALRCVRLYLSTMLVVVVVDATVIESV